MFKSDPHKARAARKLFSPEMLKKFLVIEVVDSQGCSVGLKPGDRLYFRGMTSLDLERSSSWCAYALGHLPAISSMCHDRWTEDLDPNDMIWNRFSCFDCGVRSGGWGRVTMKAYVKDESEL
ncbi:MAG: hypothetical protein WAN11_11785 [Syntrophobacteraceae bacterium]